MKLKIIVPILIVVLCSVSGVAIADADATDVKCPHCGMINCTMGCVDAAEGEDGEKYMVMGGIPKPLFYGGVGALLLLSFVIFEVSGRRDGPAQNNHKVGWRYNLLRLRPIDWLVKRKGFQFGIQLPFAAAFAFILYAGLAGDPVVNIAPVATWTIWWAGLIFAILLIGKVWCLACPWDFVASALQYLTPWRKRGKPLSLNLPWPKWLKNIYLAMGLFVFLTWLELGYGVTTQPRYTAYMGLGMLLLVMLPAVVFEKKSFCRYGCLVGRISGLYALFSPVEVRSKNKTVCDHCKTHDCFNGNDSGAPCPTSMNLATMEDNTYCTLCTECIKTCKKDNVAINLRPFGSDLMSHAKARIDEAYLAVILLSLTAFHGLTMTPLWKDHRSGNDVVSWIGRTLGTGELASFTLGMLAILALPILLFYGMCALARWLAGDRAISVKKVFVHYAYSLLPIALFYHLAHNGMHLFMEGQEIVPRMNDPMGKGANVLGLAGMPTLGPILSDTTIWYAQTLLIVTGHIVGIFISHKVSSKLYRDKAQATRSLIPMLMIMIAFSMLSLWLIHLDMNMRGTRM